MMVKQIDTETGLQALYSEHTKQKDSAHPTQILYASYQIDIENNNATLYVCMNASSF